MPALRQRDLRKHWGVSSGYVAQLAGKGMPEFEDLGPAHADRFKEADTWRAIHAPPRIRRLQRQVTDRADAPDTGFDRGEAGGCINVDRFDVPVDDFEGWAVRSAERMHKIAVGLYEDACATGDPVAIANATRNLAEVARRSKTIREDFAKLRERSRETINIDRAADIVARAMNAFVKAATGMGQRLAPYANPQDPATAQRVIDAEIDRLFEVTSQVIGALQEARSDDECAA